MIHRSCGRNNLSCLFQLWSCTAHAIYCVLQKMTDCLSNSASTSLTVSNPRQFLCGFEHKRVKEHTSAEHRCLNYMIYQCIRWVAIKIYKSKNDNRVQRFMYYILLIMKKKKTSVSLNIGVLPQAVQTQNRLTSCNAFSQIVLLHILAQMLLSNRPHKCMK